MAQPLTFFWEEQIIEVPLPDTSLDVQYLVDQVRDNEDELHPAIAYTKVMDAFGKQSLGGGSLVGITVVLLDNWKLRFHERPGAETVSCIVTGGNLVAESGNPIAPSAYTTVTIAQSSSPTIATPDDNVNLKYLIASLEGTQKIVGDFIYWDPVNGSDTNDGSTPTTAFFTFAAAQSAATAGNYDVIYALANDPSGETTVTTPISITTNTLKLRGPGHIFKITPSSAGSDSITISANDVEISGLFVSTAGTGSDNAVSITGDRALVKDCWISNVRGHGISLSSTQRTQIATSAIEHCGTSGTGNGINMASDTTQAVISKCIVYDNPNGIALSGTGIADNIIENSLIYQNSAYGITIASASVNRTVGRGGNTLANNTTGDVQDLGTDSYFEAAAGGATPAQIADAVWDEVIADHAGTGTTGKTLKDAKTKATLASLK